MFVLEPPHAYVHPYRGAVIERVLPLNELREDGCAGRRLCLDFEKQVLCGDPTQRAGQRSFCVLSARVGAL